MSSFLTVFTLVHVLISLVAIGAGFVVMYQMVRPHDSPRTTAFFLATTVLTSVSGFLFPFVKVTPGHVIGVLSLALLSVALYALYSRQLVGRWRTAYVATAFAAQYFNVFVLIVQSFQKVPALHALAPTQTEWPFVLAQGFAFFAFLIWGTLAWGRFLPAVASYERVVTK